MDLFAIGRLVPERIAFERLKKLISSQDYEIRFKRKFRVYGATRIFDSISSMPDDAILKTAFPLCR